METKCKKRRGVTEFIPVAIGVVIAIIIIVSIGIPIVNATVWNASAPVATGGYGPTVGTILENTLPLFAVSAIAVVAVALMGVFSR